MARKRSRSWNSSSKTSGRRDGGRPLRLVRPRLDDICTIPRVSVSESAQIVSAGQQDGVNVEEILVSCGEDSGSIAVRDVVSGGEDSGSIAVRDVVSGGEVSGSVAVRDVVSGGEVSGLVAVRDVVSGGEVSGLVAVGDVVSGGEVVSEPIVVDDGKEKAKEDEVTEVVDLAPEAEAVSGKSDRADKINCCFGLDTLSMISRSMGRISDNCNIIKSVIDDEISKISEKPDSITRTHDESCDTVVAEDPEHIMVENTNTSVIVDPKLPL